MSSPLITLEITITADQAHDLSNALITGANETGCSLGIEVRNLLDECISTVESLPKCSGTTRKAWLAPRQQ